MLICEAIVVIVNEAPGAVKIATMKSAFALFSALFCVVCLASRHAAWADEPLRANMLLDGGQVVLPNAWKISPAGHATKLPGDMPMRMIFTRDGKHLLVNTGGYNEHGMSVIDSA